MIELLKNSLEIITCLSKSNAGYLLKLNYKSKEIIVSLGEVQKISGPVNDILFNLFVSGKINSDNAEISSLLKKIVGEFALKSFFIKEVYSNNNSEDAVYIILLSSKANNFSSAKISSIKPALEVLAGQVKNFEEDNVHINDDNLAEGRNHNHILKHSQGFFRVLLEVSEDLLFILDQDGCFITLNDFGAASLDYSPDELVGKHFLEFVSFKEKNKAAQAIQKIIEHDKIFTFETTLISKYGNEIIFEISGNSLIEKNKIAGVLAVGKNITELRNFEEKINQLNSKLLEANRIITIERQRSKRQKAILYELNKMKSEFVSNISHELRTPLASIIGFSETIASDVNMPVEMKNEFNEIILTEGKRLAKLVNDVLDVSRIESGELELNRAESDIVVILNEVIESNKKSIDEKNLTLTTDLPSENVILMIDKERISQILNSVINNAVKFTNRNGRITISAQTLYKEFEITVSDTGIGIPAKDLPYIFQKFYRVSRPGIEIPGTGLGLVFVKQIVDLHKGFISVQSEVNKGTTVILKLPRTSKI